jgi:hypothetical protein
MTNKKKAAAQTAYELLGRVCKAIKAHPLNYCQADWMQKRDPDIDDAAPLARSLDVPENVCGTAYCVAGWVVRLHEGRDPDTTAGISKKASSLLGMDDDVAYDELFAVGYVSGVPGTPEYVAAGVKHVRDFMKTHAAHLKARSLKGV